ncbi:hypothetical protein ES332_A01G055800v1 [Gossypium tomentosum]|uniref:Uncharacterized protein n=1 Tax=Gossypium tomentosum TaxID=34277 RepID=A0A5D2RM03_GOSTO|nr:hypothetical protein ES332_A01G055800v1 [Gossypium tomentosum]
MTQDWLQMQSDDWNDVRRIFYKIQEPGAVSGVAGSCWSKLPVGWVKCNINATLCIEENAAGWSAIARDAKGHVNPMMAPKFAELYAVRRP